MAMQLPLLVTLRSHLVEIRYSITSETSNTFTPFENGVYAVEITQNNCVDTSECITISSIGLNKTNIFQQITITPNPSTGLFNITLGEGDNVSIVVYSSFGSVVFEDNHINSSIYQLNLNESMGVYFVEIQHNDRKKRYKLIIE